MISYGKQAIDKDDIQAVEDTLQSNWLTTGPKVKEFEQKFSQRIGAKYAVAVSSGTAALHLACLAAGLKQGDELITSAMSFAASANCALYCHAQPVFADIDKQGLIDITDIERKITSKTKIIIPVHYTGLPCSMAKIKQVADKYNFNKQNDESSNNNKRKIVIIEDACHALGSRWKDSRIGDCQFSDMACFSFHPVKHITTGEGGMITTNSKELYQKLLRLRTHGLTKDPHTLLNLEEGSWHWEMQELGYNYRLTDFQSALGISQLDKLDFFIRKRKTIAKRYQEAFRNVVDIETIDENEEQFNSYHIFIIKVKDKKIRLDLFNHLKENGIYCQVHYVPIYWHPYYINLGFQKGLCPQAEQFYHRIISLPLYPSLTETEHEKVIKVVKEFMEKNVIRTNKKNIEKNTGGKKMKIAIIGCGSIGKRHLRNVKALLEEKDRIEQDNIGEGKIDEENRNEVIAFDVNQEALDFVSKEYGVRTSSNFEEVLQEADGVLICTPNHLHATQALQALKNNCHVLVEKPLAHSMEYVDEIINIAQEKNLTITVGYMLRFYEPLNKVKELINNGKIGRIYGAMVQTGSFLPDWRPTQDYRQNYGAIKSQGGGIILDAIHEINYIKSLLGNVESVYCLGGRLSNLQIDTEDYASLSLRFENNIIAHVHLDYLQRSYSRGCKIIGEKGTIIWNFTNHQVKVYDAEEKSWSVSKKENFDFNTTYMEEERHFLDCVEGKTSSLVNGKEARDDLLVALAALESMRTGLPQNLKR